MTRTEPVLASAVGANMVDTNSASKTSLIAYLFMQGSFLLRRVGSGVCDLYPLPGLIGVERLRALRDGFGQLAQILLINRAGMIDLEGHDAGVAVFGRIGDQREAADHLAVDDVVELAARSARPLFRQDTKIIAVVRLRLAAADLVAFRRRLRGKFTQRTLVA